MTEAAKPFDASPEGVPAALAIAETRAWVRRAVIGLNLCPFARAVDVKDQIRYVFSEAADAETLLATLEKLGPAGWAAVRKSWEDDAAAEFGG